MKKILRFIGILLLIVIAAILLIGLIAPKETKSEVSILINAPKEVVADYMLHYGHFKDWSPWQKLDPNMKIEITGEDNAAGTKYSWEGNKDVGKGEMVTKEIKDGEMDYTMRFIEPFESTAEGFWKVEDAGNGQTKASWGFTSSASYPMNGIMMVMGMKKKIEKDFNEGLNKLKTLAEAHAKDGGSTGGFKIEEMQFPGHTYAAIRKVVAIDEAKMHEFFMDSYKQLGAGAGKRINGPASSLVYKWDEANKQADMAAAFPVSGTDAVKGAVMVTVPASSSYVIVYNGGYGRMAAAHDAIGKHVGMNKKEVSMVIEEYIKGPGDEKDSTKWVTNIIYLIK